MIILIVTICITTLWCIKIEDLNLHQELVDCKVLLEQYRVERTRLMEMIRELQGGENKEEIKWLK